MEGKLKYGGMCVEPGGDRLARKRPAGVSFVMSLVRIIIVLAIAFPIIVDADKVPPVDQRATEAPDGQWHDSNDPETFTPAQLKALKNRARHGDSEAAYRLFYHYDMGAGMKEAGAQAKAMYWLRVAAKNGLPMAEHNLGKLLSMSDARKDRAEAKFWLTKGAQDGVSESDL